MAYWQEEAPHSAIEVSSFALLVVYFKLHALRRPTIGVVKAVAEAWEVTVKQEGEASLKKAATLELKVQVASFVVINIQLHQRLHKLESC